MGRLGFSYRTTCLRCKETEASIYPSSAQWGSPDYLSCKNCGYEASSSQEGSERWVERPCSKPWTPPSNVKIPWGWVVYLALALIAATLAYR